MRVLFLGHVTVQGFMQCTSRSVGDTYLLFYWGGYTNFSEWFMKNLLYL